MGRRSFLSRTRSDPAAVAFAIAFGGSLGALCRYAVASFVNQRLVAAFPWATFVVNMTGCFIAAVVASALVDRYAAPEWLRLGILVGFLGAYTTFSAFALEIHRLAEDAAYGWALATALGSVAGGVLVVVAGTLVGRLL